MSPIRLSPLQHLISFAGAIGIATALLAGAAASAQTNGNGPAYRAELVQPAANAQVLASGVVWRCEGTSCTAARATSRPAIVCARLAREAGPVASFAVAGQALPAEQLARCNAAAN
jgi:hypothetical protein